MNVVNVLCIVMGFVIVVGIIGAGVVIKALEQVLDHADLAHACRRAEAEARDGAGE